MIGKTVKFRIGNSIESPIFSGIVVDKYRGFKNVCDAFNTSFVVIDYYLVQTERGCYNVNPSDVLFVMD